MVHTSVITWVLYNGSWKSQDSTCPLLNTPHEDSTTRNCCAFPVVGCARAHVCVCVCARACVCVWEREVYWMWKCHKTDTRRLVVEKHAMVSIKADTQHRHYFLAYVCGSLRTLRLHNEEPAAAAGSAIKSASVSLFPETVAAAPTWSEQTLRVLTQKRARHRNTFNWRIIDK